DLRRAINTNGSSWQVPYQWIRNYMAHELLVPLKGSKIRLRDDDYEMVVAHAHKSLDQLTASDFDVVGELTDLQPKLPEQNALHPEDVNDQQLLDIANTVIPSMFKELREQSDTEAQLRARVAMLK